MMSSLSPEGKSRQEAVPGDSGAPALAEPSFRAIARSREKKLTAGADDLEPELLRRILTAAVAAPSGGNSQPWAWTYRRPTLSLFHDKRRSYSLTDYQGMGGLVALGAAAENLVLAAHRERLEVSLETFPPAPPRPGGGVRISRWLWTERVARLRRAGALHRPSPHQPKNRVRGAAFRLRTAGHDGCAFLLSGRSHSSLLRSRRRPVAKSRSGVRRLPPSAQGS